MKANKIVFSSIAALALASSAFGAAGTAAISKLDADNHWYNQLQPNGGNANTKLSDLGWGADTTDAISAAIGTKDNTQAADNTIVGHLVGTVGTATHAASYDKSTLEVKTDVINTAKGNDVSFSQIVQDYAAIKDALAVATKFKELYTLLGTNETKDKKQDELVLTASDNLKGIAELILKYNPTITDNANLKKQTLDAGEVTAVLKDFVGTTSGYIDNTNATNKLSKAAAEAQALEKIQSDIITQANTIIDALKPEQKSQAKLIQKELDDAIAKYKIYKDAQDRIDAATQVLNDAKAKITTSDAATNYTATYKDIVENALGKTSAKEMSDAIFEGIKTKANDTLNSSTNTIALEEIDSNKKLSELTDTSVLTLKGLKKYLEVNGVKGTSTETEIANKINAISGTTYITNVGQLYKAVSAIISAVDSGKKIEFGASDLAAAADDAGKIDTALGEVVSVVGSTALGFTDQNLKDYQKAISSATTNATTANIQAVIDANTKLQEVYANLSSLSQATAEATATQESALGESLAQVAKTDASVKTAMNELNDLLVKDGAKITEASVKTDAGTEWDSLSKEAKEALGTDGATKDAYQTYKVNQHNAAIQTAANNVANAVANAKKDSLAVEGLSTLNIQLNNMNKRLGEIRGLDGEIGVWLRTWGGKMSADHDSFKYYSTQLGADKKTAMKDGDLYLGVLVGYDNVKSDIKSNAYSVGAYASYIDNSGFFADGVMKFVSTKNERSGFDLSNQQTLLASIEGGYRFDMSDGFYVEPSLEFVTGHVGEYKSKEKGSNTTLKVDSFTPVVFKPQVFVGGSADAFTYRAGIGGVLSMQGQDASVEIANIAHNLNDAPVKGSSTVKLSKNNHGFASIGGSFKASENFRINLGVERSFGGDLTNDYEVNMTLRYGF